MTIQGAFGTHLRLTPDVSALIGDRVYPVQAPDNCPVPYVVYSFSRADDDPITKPADDAPPIPLAGAELAVTVVSRNHGHSSGYDEAWEAAEAIRKDLVYFKGDMNGISVQGTRCTAMRDEIAAEFGLFEVASTYQIFWAL